jgi:hypothetical protein
VTIIGRAVGLLIAFWTVGILVGVTVGVYRILALTTNLVECAKGKSLAFQFMHFLVCVLFGLPLLLVPLASMLGSLLADVEDWPRNTDGMLYIGGSWVFQRLTHVIPTSKVGKDLDFLTSCLGIGLLSFTIAIVGALPVVEVVCEKIGGKSERRLMAFGSSLVFFLVLLPIVCVVMAVPFGALVVAEEGWCFMDGWLYAGSVLLHSPGLAPAAAVPRSHRGSSALDFLMALYFVALTLGLGAGVTGVSRSLDSCSKMAQKCLSDGAQGPVAAVKEEVAADQEDLYADEDLDEIICRGDEDVDGDEDLDEILCRGDEDLDGDECLDVHVELRAHVKSCPRRVGDDPAHVELPVVVDLVATKPMDLVVPPVLSDLVEACPRRVGDDPANVELPVVVDLVATKPMDVVVSPVLADLVESCPRRGDEDVDGDECLDVHVELRAHVELPVVVDLVATMPMAVVVPPVLADLVLAGGAQGQDDACSDASSDYDL